MSDSTPSSVPTFGWLQISLRTFFVLLTLVGIAMGIWVNRSRAQQQAVQTLRAAGAHVTYADGLCDGALASTGSTFWNCETGREYYSQDELQSAAGPPWHYCCLGQDYFRTVGAVHFFGVGFDQIDAGRPGEPFDPALLQQLSALPGLRRVSLDARGIWFPEGDNLEDSDLAYLADLVSLERLFLRGQDITDEGLVHLAGLTNLEYLSLAETKITDRGLSHLRGLTKLHYLELEQTQITDAGMEQLQELTVIVTVGETKVTPECMRRHEERGPNVWLDFSSERQPRPGPRLVHSMPAHPG